MGIPFYFKNLISRFPDIIKRPSHHCTHLYLDYNCIIHTCAANLTKLGMHHDNPTEFQSMVIEDSLTYISTITNCIAPTKMLYIAVDGSCPRAKMQQQRKRRFMSVWRNEKIRELHQTKESSAYETSHTHVWDSNIVTPGTDFMKAFDIALDKYVCNANSKGELKYTVACSNSSEFGEGEHKIFDLMTKQNINATSNDDDKHIIYGLDADLIMLSMIQPSKGAIMLLREVPEFNVPQHRVINNNDAFLLLDIDVLKEALVKECLLGDPKRIPDYVMICSLIGNDFVPPLSYLKIKNDGIEVLLRLYEKVTKNPCRLASPYMVTYDSTKCSYEIDNNFLTDLIHELSIIENSCIVEADSAYYNKRTFADRRYVSPENQVDNYPSLHKFPKHINVTQPNWRLSYYKNLFHYSDKDVVQKACERYVEGINWIFKYYFTKDFNCAWYYPFCYSPTCLDLFNFLVSTQDSQSALVSLTANSHVTHLEFKGIMSHSDMHLLMVLPPQSAKTLLLPNVAAIMTDVHLGCVHYYPKTIEISRYLKAYLWECGAILPDIDIRRVYEAYINQTVNQKK